MSRPILEKLLFLLLGALFWGLALYFAPHGM